MPLEPFSPIFHLFDEKALEVHALGYSSVIMCGCIRLIQPKWYSVCLCLYIHFNMKYMTFIWMRCCCWCDKESIISSVRKICFSFWPLQEITEEKYEIRLCVEEAGLIVTKEPAMTMTVSLTSPAFRDQPSPDAAGKSLLPGSLLHLPLLHHSFSIIPPSEALIP